MKQLIKSAILYSAVLPPLAELETHLALQGFMEPLGLQVKSLGFVPREDFGPLVEGFAGGVAFTVRLDQKIIPGSVVKAEVAKRAAGVERLTGRRVGKKEKIDIRFEVIDELAQRALVRTTLLTCYHHTASNTLILPTNKKLAEEVVHALVMAVGSVKITSIHVNGVSNGLTERLKEWLSDSEDFGRDGVYPTNEVALEQDGRKVSVKMGDLQSATAALKEALTSGFYVKSLGLAFPQGTEARLTSDFHLKNILMYAAADTGEGEDEAPTFAAQASLEVAEVVEVAQILCEMFDYQAPTDEVL